MNKNDSSKPVMTLTEFSRLGGHARAAKLSPKRRKEIARQAAKTRWLKKSA